MLNRLKQWYRNHKPPEHALAPEPPKPPLLLGGNRSHDIGAGQLSVTMGYGMRQPEGKYLVGWSRWPEVRHLKTKYKRGPLKGRCYFQRTVKRDSK